MGPTALDNLGDSNYSIIQVTTTNSPSLFRFFFFKNKLQKHPSGQCVVLPWSSRWTSSSKYLDVFLSLGRPARKLLVTARNWAFCCPSASRPSYQGLWGLGDTREVPHTRGAPSLSMTHTDQTLHLISPRLSGHSAADGLSWASTGGVSETTRRPTEVWVSTSSFSMRVCASETCWAAALSA